MEHLKRLSRLVSRSKTFFAAASSTHAVPASRVCCTPARGPLRVIAVVLLLASISACDSNDDEQPASTTAHDLGSNMASSTATHGASSTNGAGQNTGSSSTGPAQTTTSGPGTESSSTSGMAETTTATDGVTITTWATTDSGTTQGVEMCDLTAEDSACTTCAKTNCCGVFVVCADVPGCSCMHTCALEGRALDECMPMCPEFTGPVLTGPLNELMQCVIDACAEHRCYHRSTNNAANDNPHPGPAVKR